MAMIIFDRLNRKLTLEEVRTSMINCSLVKVPIRQKILTIMLHPVNLDTPTKKYITGTAIWKGENINLRVGLVGNLCELKDGRQAVSLKKLRGTYINDMWYRRLDEVLEKILRNLVAVMLNISSDEMEFTEPVVGKSGRETTLINPGKWGKQSCGFFEWSDEAIEQINSGATLHRWCSRCSKLKVDDVICPRAAQIMANRRKAPDESQLKLRLGVG